MRHLKCRILVGAFIFLGLFVIGRIFWINQQHPQIPHKQYKSFEWVDLAGVKLSEYSNSDGYAIKVIDKRLMTVEEFLEKFASKNEIEEYTKMVDEGYVLKPNNIFLVTVSLKNYSDVETTERGIDWLYMYLYYKNIVLDFDSNLYGLANRSAGGSAQLSLRPNTEKEFFLPYCVYDELFLKSEENLLDIPFEMVLSVWPVMKTIQL